MTKCYCRLETPGKELYCRHCWDTAIQTRTVKMEQLQTRIEQLTQENKTLKSKKETAMNLDNLLEDAAHGKGRLEALRQESQDDLQNVGEHDGNKPLTDSEDRYMDNGAVEYQWRNGQAVITLNGWDGDPNIELTLGIRVVIEKVAVAACDPEGGAAIHP